MTAKKQSQAKQKGKVPTEDAAPIVPIADGAALAAFCGRQRQAAYVTVDTEFMRDRTYWPQLCLVQLAGPDEAVVVDALAAGLDLQPLFDLLSDGAVLKVFHAARQDIEIFYHLSGVVPHPVFDTQVAGMVCGFGESVAYDKLVARLAGARIDKSSRVTDWARRPLSDTQLRYALSDVTHLRVAYEKLAQKLEKNGRANWLDEEMAILTAPETYRTDPEEAYRRIKARGGNRRFHAVLRAVAALREREAQARDLPRNRLLRDESLLEIAAHRPTSEEQLAKVRGMGGGTARSKIGQSVLEAVQAVADIPDQDLPKPPEREEMPVGIGPLSELLRVLLKTNAERHQVAQKLIASGDDLEKIAAGRVEGVPAMSGWRAKIFGDDALALCRGELALAAGNNKVRLVRVPPADDQETASDTGHDSESDDGDSRDADAAD